MSETKKSNMKGLAAALALLAGPAAAVELPNGVAAGEVGQTTVVLWAKASGPGSLWFSYATDPAMTQNLVTFPFIDVKDADLPAKQPIKGLKRDTVYYYCARDSYRNKSCGHFRTMPSPNATGTGLVFGLAGSLNPLYQVFPGANNLAAADLDFLFDMSADTDVFSDFDWEGFSQFAGVYAKGLGAHGGFPNAFAAARASTATFPVLTYGAVYDGFAGGADPASDSRFDNTGGFVNETQRYKAATKAFSLFAPVYTRRFGDTQDPRTAFKPSFERSFRVGKDAAFIVLDAYSFRDAPVPGPDATDQNQIVQYYQQTYASPRTALGAQQLADVKRALDDAQAQGVRWKFVVLGSTMQSFGVYGETKVRMENYALERNELLAHIAQKDIRNVVFLGNEGPLYSVNNLGYQPGPGWPVTPVNAFEVLAPHMGCGCGPGAADALVAAAVQAKLLSEAEQQFYHSLPVAPDTDDIANDKDDFIKTLFNRVLTGQGLDTVGLAGSSLQATLEAGDYLSMHHMGWTKFAIEPGTLKLTVTAYGVPGAPLSTFINDPASLANLVPEVISQFEVLPQ